MSKIEKNIEDVLEDDIFKLKESIMNNAYQKDGYLLGKILTIIDATIIDGTQRKAIKDLIRGAIYNDNTIYKDNFTEKSFQEVLSFLEVWLRQTEAEVVIKMRAENKNNIKGDTHYPTRLEDISKPC